MKRRGFLKGAAVVAGAPLIAQAQQSLPTTANTPATPAVRPPSTAERAAETTASADVPMKGLAYLLEALAKLRTEQPDAHLVIVGEPRPASSAAKTLERLGLEGAVSFRPRVSDAELDAIPLRRHEWHGEWNYTVLPARHTPESIS